MRSTLRRIAGSTERDDEQNRIGNRSGKRDWPSSGAGLLAAGYEVVLAGRRPAALQSTISRAPADSICCAVPTDVRDEKSVEKLYETIRDRFGRLDFLFNNAGLAAAPTPFDQLSVDQWDQVVSVNLTGAFLCARGAFRLMKGQNPQGGRIVNNGSLSAHVPRPGSAPYTATKHAITGLTKSISLEAGRTTSPAARSI